MEKQKELREVLKAIRLNTQPIEGHTDPNSIDDCWNEVYELIDGIETRDQLLLDRSAQMIKEAEAYPDNEFYDAIKRGITQVVGLINRHIPVVVNKPLTQKEGTHGK